jgi:carotenoid cleavage dioxygenase-like enzyme
LWTQLGPSPWIGVTEQPLGSTERRVVARIKGKKVPYQHSFGLMPKSAVVLGCPLLVAPSRLLFSKKGYIEHFTWEPEQGTRVSVVDRATGAVREHVADPFFTFHVANAFEDGADTVIDYCAYEDSSFIDTLRTDAMARAPFDARAKLVRMRLTPGRERARIEPLGDVAFEFPNVAYRRKNGQPYGVVWGAAIAPSGKTWSSSVQRVDLANDCAVTTFEEPGWVFGEPVFVPRPDGTAEDDGVILTVGSSLDRDATALAILDAHSLDVVAWAEVPLATPLGFHGSYVR